MDRRLTANCTPVALINIKQTVPPAASGLPTCSSPDSRAGPSDNTNEVAEIPGANTAMPRARSNWFCAGTVGRRRRQAEAPLPPRGTPGKGRAKADEALQACFSRFPP